MKNKKKGFTLVELLVVIAILAVLASVSVVGYVGFTTKAKQSACLQEAKQIQTTIFAAMVDGKEEYTNKDDKTTYTVVYEGTKLVLNDDKKTPATLDQICNVFDLNEFKAKLALNADVLTYTSNGYSCVINYDGSELTATPTK